MLKLLQRKKLSFLLLLPVAWFAAVSLLLVVIILIIINMDPSKDDEYKYELYAAKPLVLGTVTTDTTSGDPRPAKIDKIFEKYNCPIQGMGKVFVEEADKNNIPYWVVPAISFQESICGKKIPTVDGQSSYNAWGWAVYGANVKTFDSWEHGIEVVSKYMSDRFFSQNITDLCEIMKIYTPPSQGSWCRGVDYFKEVIDEYKSPK